MLAKNTFGCPFFSFGRSPAHIANRRFAYVCSRKRLPTARYQTEQSDLDPEQNVWSHSIALNCYDLAYYS